jgi:hypothetical protein
MGKTIDDQYGPIVYQTASHVLRAKTVGDGIEVYVHRLVDGLEQKPLGYMYGSNYLITNDDKTGNWRGS